MEQERKGSSTNGTGLLRRDEAAIRLPFVKPAMGPMDQTQLTELIDRISSYLEKDRVTLPAEAVDLFDEVLALLRTAAHAPPDVSRPIPWDTIADMLWRVMRFMLEADPRDLIDL